MPTLHLHVGPHKTASTYLQQEFTRQRGALRQQGITYPRAGAEFGSAHHNIAWVVAGRKVLNATPADISSGVAALVQERPDRLLISSEEFMRLSEPALVAVRQLFEPYAFQVLYVRREEATLIVSLWQELVKHGYTIPLDKVTPELLVRGFGYDPFAHEGNVARLESCLGGPVSVIDYTALRAGGIDVITAFGSALGVQLETRPSRANTRLPFEVAELIRAANLHSSLMGQKRTMFPRKATLDVLQGPDGEELREHVRKRALALAVHPKVDAFVRAGFPASIAASETAIEGLAYVPERRLYDALNRDRLRPWETLRSRVADGVASDRKGFVRDIATRVRRSVRSAARGR